jgi:hypothetical protein
MRSALAAGGATLILLAGGLPAQADVFGPISLASESKTEQALYARDPAISGDGRYIAWDGSFEGLTGVWRSDLQTGEVQPVAVRDPTDPAISAPDAELPSISENGQYVSFTTTARLSRDDTNEGPDVYVRDMEVPASAPCEPGQAAKRECAYTLVSAVNGSEEGLDYATSGPSAKGYGSVAAGRSAMSANGQYVVFVTTAVSDLLPEKPLSAGASRPVETPALQVAVRDLQTQETKLVSVRDNPASGEPALNPETGEPQPVSAEEESNTFGAVSFGHGGVAPSFEAPHGEGHHLTSVLGASISADGSTVAWLGNNIAEQAKVLPGELMAMTPTYSEPLWRRIADGPDAPTRRVTGGSDPEDPACAASGEALPTSLSDPCQGPFYTPLGEETPGIWRGVSEGSLVPRLSADGYTVAFLAEAPLASVVGTKLQNVENGDLFVANMHPGLTRTQALRQLTEPASASGGEIAATAPIVDMDISADGTQVAFTTKRTQFPLGSLTDVTAPAAVPGMLELFDVDLADDTLTRVSTGYEGGQSEHEHEEFPAGVDPYTEAYDGALSPSFSDDGETLAFSSTASNLVYGDGNSPPRSEDGRLEGMEELDGSDAFVVSHVEFQPTVTPQFISAAPTVAGLAPSRRLSATAVSQPDGEVLLEVEVPGAGTLRANAGAWVVVGSAHAHARAHKDAAHKGTAHKGSVRSARTHARVAVATRTVASAAKKTSSSTGGLVTLTLRLTAPYRALAGRSSGLSATAELSFSAYGTSTLRESLAITFRKVAQHGKKDSRARSTRRHKPTARSRAK